MARVLRFRPGQRQCILLLCILFRVCGFCRIVFGLGRFQGTAEDRAFNP
jgi:hypothetical protein